MYAFNQFQKIWTLKVKIVLIITYVITFLIQRVLMRQLSMFWETWNQKYTFFVMTSVCAVLPIYKPRNEYTGMMSDLCSATNIQTKNE